MRVAYCRAASVLERSVSWLGSVTEYTVEILEERRPLHPGPRAIPTKSEPSETRTWSFSKPRFRQPKLEFPSDLRSICRRTFFRHLLRSADRFAREEDMARIWFSYLP